MVSLTNSAYIPSEDDTRLSQESYRILANHANSTGRQIRVVEADGQEYGAIIPAEAYRLLLDVLKQMAQGNAVTLIPIHAELTTQEAADLLNVSRPFLIKKLEEGALPYHRIGSHRRIRFHDLLAYKQRLEKTASEAFEQMISLSQELGLYD